MKVKEEREKVGLKLNIQKTKSWHLVPSLHGKQMGKQWKQWQPLFWGGSKITADGDCMKLKDACSLEKNYDQPRQHIKKQRHYFVNKGPCSQSYGFSSSRVWMWELDYKESWVPKSRCFWTVLLEKTLESPLDCQEIKPVHPKENQSWRTEAEAETPVFWPPDVKNWHIGKDLGKDWRWEEKGMTEDEMVGWHHHLNGHEFE